MEKLKRMLAASMAVMLTGLAVTSYADADGDVQYKGDINRDGFVTADDVSIFQHCLTKSAFLEIEDVPYVDFNADEKINVYDMILVKRVAMGIKDLIEIPTDPTEPDIPTEPVTDPTEPDVPTESVTDPTEPDVPTEPVTDPTEPDVPTEPVTEPTEPVNEPITIADMPQEYVYAADWIWNNRVLVEKSTEKRNTIFDQIVAGNGTLNYVVRWQSYKTVTLEQRQAFEDMLDKAVNDWTDWLVGYENWPYEHVDVKIVGWAVIDESVLLDRQPDEIVYTSTTPYDSSGDTSNGYETIPTLLPNAPDELSRMEHWADSSYEYPGGLDKRFDMYMWATEGFPSIGGCGGDWGQRLSDTAYLNMLDGTGIHVFEHELGHGFGMTDFYGGEGESNGFPPGGFPGEENSLMMAGSAVKITDFDGWELRYFWSKIKDEEGRFTNIK